MLIVKNLTPSAPVSQLLPSLFVHSAGPVDVVEELRHKVWLVDTSVQHLPLHLFRPFFFINTTLHRDIHVSTSEMFIWMNLRRT